MRILAFQAERFAWQPFSRTLDDADEHPPGGEVHEAVVAFVHVESFDLDEAHAPSIFRRALKHLKWLANKRKLRRFVLHSFAHLGGDNANPRDALDLLQRLQARLEGTGYEVWMTPFGWFCSWTLSVYGDSLAKVYKAIEPTPPK